MGRESWIMDPLSVSVTSQNMLSWQPELMATDRAGGVGLVEVCGKQELVHRSDVGFVQDKLEIVVQVSHSPGCLREASKKPY